MAIEIPPDRDDESLPELTQLDADAAPVDLAILDKLRDRSTREFQTARSTDPHDATRHVQSSPAGSRTMLTTSKLVVSLTVALMTGLAAFLGGLGDTQAAVTFGDVLKHVASADTLKLQVVQGEQKSDVLVRQPGQVRWEDSPTQYRIASGSRLWRIDEEANSAKDGASPEWHCSCVFLGVGVQRRSGRQLAVSEKAAGCY